MKEQTVDRLVVTVWVAILVFTAVVFGGLVWTAIYLIHKL